jgi:hypothetical protein
MSAIGIGLLTFLLVRRSVLAGGGEAVLILGAFWFAG